jgi:hypothetical protein
MMAYDAKDNYTVLFGGYDGSVLFNDTWIFAAGNWTKVSSAKSPGGSWLNVLTYDGADGYLMLLGGFYNDWTFQGGNWSQVPVKSPPYAVGQSVAAAYDAARGYVVLFGGCTKGAFGQVCTNQTWLYAHGVWTHLKLSPAPTLRQETSAAYDPANGALVMFGGAGRGFHRTSQTWTYT